MLKTYAVSSDLTGAALATLRDLWDHLECRYGLQAVKRAVRPHLTYVVGQTENAAGMSGLILSAATLIAPFEIELNSLEFFPAEQPTVFLKPTHTPDLTRAHAIITQVMRQAGLAIDPYYRPETWVPHVTLATKDLTPEQLPALLTELEQMPLRLATCLAAFDLVQVTEPADIYLRTAPFRSCE